MIYYSNYTLSQFTNGKLFFNLRSKSRSQSPNFVVTLDGVDPSILKSSTATDEVEEAEMNPSPTPTPTPVIEPTPIMNPIPVVNPTPVIKSKLVEVSNVHERLGRPMPLVAPIKPPTNVVKVRPQQKTQMQLQDMLGDDDDDILVELDSNEDGEGISAVSVGRCINQFVPSSFIH